MQSDNDEWQRWFDSEMPEIAKLPGDYQNCLSNFDRLILLRAMRPDRVTTALKSWIEEMMGKEYVFQRPFDMVATFAETSNQTPTFFVLFAGVSIYTCSKVFFCIVIHWFFILLFVWLFVTMKLNFSLSLFLFILVFGNVHITMSSAWDQIEISI